MEIDTNDKEDYKEEITIEDFLQLEKEKVEVSIRRGGKKWRYFKCYSLNNLKHVGCTLDCIQKYCFDQTVKTLLMIIWYCTIEKEKNKLRWLS